MAFYGITVNFEGTRENVLHIFRALKAASDIHRSVKVTADIKRAFKTSSSHGNTVWAFDFSFYIFVHKIQSQMGSDVEVNPSCYYPSLDYCANSYTQELIVQVTFSEKKKVLSLFIIAEKYINLKRGFTSGNFWHDLTFYTIIFCDYSCTSSLRFLSVLQFNIPRLTIIIYYWNSNKRIYFTHAIITRSWLQTVRLNG